MIAVNPILERELRARFRGKRSFLLLTLFVLVEIGAFFLIYATIALGDPSGGLYVGNPSVGRRVFDAFGVLLVLLVGAFTPASAASVIAGERDKRTLEFLELTLLTPREIVMGKLAVALMYVGVLCVTALPVISLVFVLGGVSPQYVVGLYLTLALMAAMLGSIGVWASSVCRTAMGATVLSYVLACMTAPAWGGLLEASQTRGGSWSHLLAPGFPCFGMELRAVTVLAIAGALIANVLVQHAAAQLAEDDAPPVAERLSIWLAFTGALVLMAGFCEGMKKSVGESGLPAYLSVELWLLFIVCATHAMSRAMPAERALSPAAAVRTLPDWRGALRLRLLGGPSFLLVLCFTGLVVMGVSAVGMTSRPELFVYEAVAYHALIAVMMLGFSTALTAAAALWERFTPEFPRALRLAAAGLAVLVLFTAEFLHYSMFQVRPDHEPLPAPAAVFLFLSPVKALSSMDTWVGPMSTSRNWPCARWSDVAPFPGSSLPGWVGTLLVYGTMAALGALAIALLQRRREGAP